MVYLTPSGAVKALQAYTGLYYAQKINRQQDSIIRYQHRSILLKDVQISSLQDLTLDQKEQIKAQRKKMLWQKVEIWGYRIGIGGAIYFALFR